MDFIPMGELMKGLTLVCQGENTCQALTGQLQELLGAKVRLRSFYLDGIMPQQLSDDLVLLSSHVIQKQAQAYIQPGCPVLVARRSLNYHDLEHLLDLPAGTEVLLVNETEITAQETRNLLVALGIDHICYHPCSPGKMPDVLPLIAVTPGEAQYIPPGVKRVIDIRPRNIDFSTLVEIMQFFSLLEEELQVILASSLRDMIDLIKKNRRMARQNRQTSEKLQTLIHLAQNGIVACDENGVITIFNQVAAQLVRQEATQVLGKKMEELELGLLELLKGNGHEGERVAAFQGRQLMIHSAPFTDEQAEMGWMYIIRDATDIQRMEQEVRRKLSPQRNVARYTFANICGTSPAILAAKDRALKMAGSDAPVLIQGKSGTGKELFAQSIHNASPRCQGPFTAINFAAMTESLLESELFGYVEGAFTGAKRGGFAGLFEQSHGGTIFLDEIGDAPPAFQIRLLRVLQEKQIRRVGSAEVIPVDVRIITATHTDLKELIAQGRFRQDLYYRLRVLPFVLPELQERREDIWPLCRVYYEKFFGESVCLSPEEYFADIRSVLEGYSWPGNVRELQNIMEYLANISREQVPQIEDLPTEMLQKKCLDMVDLPAPQQQVLDLIQKEEQAGRIWGRRSLAKLSGLSEWRIRQILKELGFGCRKERE